MKRRVGIFLAILLTQFVFSQNCTCTLTGSQFPTSTLTPTTSWQTQTILSVGSYYQVFNVVSENEYTWSICSLAKGLYVVRLTANGKSVYRKVAITE